MDSYSILKKIEEERGIKLTDTEKLDIALEYIDNQQSPDAFQDFAEENISQ